VLADFFRPFYKTVTVDAGVGYDSNMRAWYSAVGTWVWKIDVVSMYPTALLMLHEAGRAAVDPRWISVFRQYMAFRRRYSSGDRYVALLNVEHSDYAVYRKPGARPCRSAEVRYYMEAEPRPFREVAEVVNSLPCPAVVVRAKDLAKYVMLIAIGRVKLYDSASWHNLIAYAHYRFMQAVYRFRLHENEDVVGVYVDTAFVFSKPHQFVKYVGEAGYEARIDGGANDAAVILPVNYYISEDVMGAWLIGVEDRRTVDASEAACGEYPTACAAYVNRYVKAGRATDAWCRYAEKTGCVKCLSYGEAAVLECIRKVDIQWGERELKAVMDRFRAQYLTDRLGFA
jgi:hypothetical protein